MTNFILKVQKYSEHPSLTNDIFYAELRESSGLYGICERMEAGRIDRRMYEYTSLPNNLQ
jgi:hypothetical protein